jgi:hypothetical protein
VPIDDLPPINNGTMFWTQPRTDLSLRERWPYLCRADRGRARLLA